MRIRIALTLLILLSLGKSSAYPINKQVTQEATTEVKSVVLPQPQESAPVETQPAAQPVVSAPVTYHSDNFYMEYIFQHESTNRLSAVNSIGCIGLGQDCNGQLAVRCPNWTTDQACQVSFFSEYAIRRYGSWSSAYNFWVSNHWW